MNSEEVQKQIQEVEALRKETMIWKIGGILVILAIILFNVFAIVNKGKALAKDGPEQKILKDELMASVTNSLVPTVKSSVTNALGKAMGHLENEKKALQENLPQIQDVFFRELDRMADALPTHATNILEKTFGKHIAERELLIRKLYPSLSEDKLLEIIKQLNDEAEDQLELIANDLLHDQMVSINEIMFNLEKIAKDEDTDLYTDNDAPWIFGTLVWEILETEFRDDTTPQLVKELEEKGGK